MCPSYPVHLHVLKLQAKVIALNEIAPAVCFRQEGLSISLRLHMKEREREKIRM